jgi:hypothetical protein
MTERRPYRPSRFFIGTLVAIAVILLVLVPPALALQSEGPWRDAVERFYSPLYWALDNLGL